MIYSTGSVLWLLVWHKCIDADAMRASGNMWMECIHIRMFFFSLVGSVWENCCQAVGISVRDIIICGIERKTTHCFRATVLRWGDTERELVARVPAKNLLKFMDEKYYKIANTHSQSILHFVEYAIRSCLLLLFDVDCVAHCSFSLSVFLFGQNCSGKSILISKTTKWGKGKGTYTQNNHKPNEMNATECSRPTLYSVHLEQTDDYF